MSVAEVREYLGEMYEDLLFADGCGIPLKGNNKVIKIHL